MFRATQSITVGKGPHSEAKFKAFTTKHRKDCTWADSTCIVLAAAFFEIDLVSVESGGKREKHCVVRPMLTLQNQDFEGAAKMISVMATTLNISHPVKTQPNYSHRNE